MFDWCAWLRIVEDYRMPVLAACWSCTRGYILVQAVVKHCHPHAAAYVMAWVRVSHGKGLFARTA